MSRAGWKMNKKVIIVIVLLLVGLGGLVGWYLFTLKKDVVDSSAEMSFGLVERNEVAVDKLLNYNSGNIIAFKNGKMGVIKSDGTVVIDFIYDQYYLYHFTKNYFVFKKDNKYVLLNDKGEEILSSNEDILISNELGDSIYFIGLENNSLYDIDGNVVYNDVNSYSYVFDDYVINDTEVVNFKTQEKFKIKSYYDLGENYILFYLDNYYKLYDVKEKKWTNYNKMKANDYVYELSNDNEIFVISVDGKKLENAYYKVIDDNYYMDLGMCKSGGVLKNSYDEIVIDDCNESYDVSLADKNVYIVNDYNNYKSKVIFNDGSSKEFDHIIWSQGDFIVSDDRDHNFKIYDLNGAEVKNTCNVSLRYYKDDLYICADDIGSFFIDKDFKKLSDYYDSIYCLESNVCFIESNKLYGIYYGNEVIIEPSYYNLTEEENYIIGDKVLEYDILKFGQSDKIELDYKKAVFSSSYDIDIEKLISEYELEDIKDLIYDHDGLFLKYAYVVLNNDKLTDFKKEVFDVFKVVAINEEYLDVAKLFSGLLSLSIEKVDNLEVLGAAGAYWDADKKIKFLTKERTVVYHELMHFLDFNFNNTNYKSLYNCDGVYLTYDEYKEFYLKEEKVCESVYIDTYSTLLNEAGAEVSMGVYMDDGVTTTYQNPTLIYNTLSYLYGDQVLNEIYFSDNGIYTLFRLLRDSGLSFSEYQEFMELANSTTQINGSLDDKSIIKICDYLVLLYSNVKDTQWYNDEYMVYIMSSILFNVNINYSDTVNYDEYIKCKNNYHQFIQHVLEKTGTEYSIRTNGSFLYFDGKGYLIMPVYKGNTIGNIKIDYDFVNDNVDDYVYKEYRW